MKKMYILGAFALLSSVSHAQFVVDFDAYPLAAESYDNGQTAGGSFDMGYITLSNTYTVDTVWGNYWSGFAISNVTDNTTAGNQYGAYAGSGYNGSSTFAVYSFDGEINTSSPDFSIDSFKISNSTYSAISMRDGDFFGKQFGSPLNAQGNADGTNGEDYFRVWVIGEDAAGTEADSVVIYLADYRFANNADDYILETWENVDFTGFSFFVNKVTFRFESSDVGAVGMNTPAYLVVDEFNIYEVLSTPELPSIVVKAYPNPCSDILNVIAPAGKMTMVDFSGKHILEMEHYATSQIDMTAFASGSYLLTVTTDEGSATVHIVK